MQLGDTYKRYDKPTKKWSSPKTIKTLSDLKLNRELQSAGIKYEIVDRSKV